MLMIDGFHLLRPELLWGLALCPLVALALWYRRIHQGDWTRVIDPELLPHLLPEQRGQTKRARVWAPTVLLALVTLAVNVRSRASGIPITISVHVYD